MSDLEIRALKKSYKNKPVLTGVDLSVERGQCIGILGRNGSGKSTLLQILAGILSPDEGSFTLFGGDGFDRRASRRLVGYVPQGAHFFEELSARDNLRLWFDKKELENELESGVLKKLGIGEFVDMRVSKLSGGMKKRLSIGCAMAGKPSVLLLDEPTGALDLPLKQELHGYFFDFVRAGGIVLLVTHEEGEIPLCDELRLLVDGKLVPCGRDEGIEKIVAWMK